METFRIALAQTRSHVGTADFDPRDANLEIALDNIQRAAEKQADLVVFGEMHLNGYRTDEHLHRYATVVEPIDRHLQALVAAAKRYRQVIVMGAATFGKRMPGDIYNSAVILAAEGVLGVYSKAHVAAYSSSTGVYGERCFYSPGQVLPVFDTPVCRLGVHICYDVSFPEVARVQALQGADLLVNVSGALAGFEEYWQHALFMRAVENASWYVKCSVVGEQRGDVLFGGSRVISPTGEVVAEARHHEEDLVVADIDLYAMMAVRSQSHLFSVRNPALYQRICEPTPFP
jgi:predicted amidohydrolase